MVLEKWFCKILELFHSFGKDLANSNQKVKPGNVSLRKRALELEWACSRHLILLKQKQLRILGISVSNLLKKLDQSVKPRVRKYFILKSGKNQTNKTLKGCCFCDRGWVPVVTSSWLGTGQWPLSSAILPLNYYTPAMRLPSPRPEARAWFQQSLIHKGKMELCLGS